MIYLENGESDAPAVEEQRAPANVLWDLRGEVRHLSVREKTWRARSMLERDSMLGKKVEGPRQDRPALHFADDDILRYTQCTYIHGSPNGHNEGVGIEGGRLTS